MVRNDNNSENLKVNDINIKAKQDNDPLNHKLPNQPPPYNSAAGNNPQNFNMPYPPPWSPYGPGYYPPPYAQYNNPGNNVQGFHGQYPPPFYGPGYYPPPPYVPQNNQNNGEQIPPPPDYFATSIFSNKNNTLPKNLNKKLKKVNISTIVFCSSWIIFLICFIALIFSGLILLNSILLYIGILFVAFFGISWIGSLVCSIIGGVWTSPLSKRDESFGKLTVFYILGFLIPIVQFVVVIIIFKKLKKKPELLKN